jgi:hypothetical protein
LDSRRGRIHGMRFQPGFRYARSAVVLLRDTFTDSDATEIDAHTMDVGAGWTELPAGTFRIQSNKLAATNAGESNLVIAAEAGQANCTITVDFAVRASGDSTRGVAWRVTDADNHWLFLHTLAAATDGCRIFKKEAASYSLEATAATPVPVNSATHELKVVLSGNNHNCFVDGAAVVNTSNATFNTVTKHGLYANPNSGATPDTTSTLDNFLVVP